MGKVARVSGAAGGIGRAVAAVADLLGPVDCLVNAVGVTNTVAPLARMTDEQWQRDLGVNLTGPLHLIRAVLPAMVQRPSSTLDGAGIDIDGGSHLCPVVPGSVREVRARRSHRHGAGRADADPHSGDRQ